MNEINDRNLQIVINTDTFLSCGDCRSEQWTPFDFFKSAEGHFLYKSDGL